MGKPRLVRIANRGSFPRWRLEGVGSTSKRAKMDDTSQGGWFGSGTKIAPIAALALGMKVWITSTDAEGTYLVTYDVLRRKRDGEDDSRVVRVYHAPDGSEARRDVTDFSPDSFMNWSKPIGDDDKKEFRVWREYFRNAKDADPNSPYVSEVDRVVTAKADVTGVFLTRTAEYAAIMRDVNRYFKYLSTDKAFFIVPGIGQFWPKSEKGVTRLFSLGTMAYCNDCKRANWSSLYDYSFDNKELMSEERTFENMNKVFLELARMLCAVASAQLARALLEAMFDGKAELERIAVAQVGSKWPISGKGHWKAAWHAIHGDDAVIGVGNWADQHVRVSFGKNPVQLSSHTLREFLKLCGVQDSSDVIPASDRMGYRVVMPTPSEKAVLDEARAILLQRHPEMRDVPVRVYEALDRQTAQSARGFCMPPTPPFK
ncbi:MAG TPA: hypothetical protein VJ694_03895, partial [Patescibacteria group bacterium]|nr:hypothetical protein [Patescibacteria group bacterium]